MIEWDCGQNAYYAKSKLPSGNTIKIVFYKEDTRHKTYYSIYLVTTRKRTQEAAATLKQTGRDGLTGLLWAKDMVRNFENFIVNEKPNKEVIIYCFWDDNRRRNVYERGLTKLGYSFGKLFYRKVLYKQVV
jgi:hypothetical protein